MRACPGSASPAAPGRTGRGDRGAAAAARPSSLEPGARRHSLSRRAAAGVPAAAADDPLIDERVVTAPEVELARLADGRYRVVIRAIDAEGLEGADAEARLELDARPEPPIAQAPALDAVRVSAIAPRSPGPGPPA